MVDAPDELDGVRVAVRGLDFAAAHSRTAASAQALLSLAPGWPRSLAELLRVSTRFGAGEI